MSEGLERIEKAIHEASNDAPNGVLEFTHLYITTVL